MAKEKDRLFRILADGLTIGYSVCMKGDLVKNAHCSDSGSALLANKGEHPILGKCIEEVPLNTKPSKGCRMFGSIYGGPTAAAEAEAEAEDIGMVDKDGEPAERKEPTTNKRKKRKKTAKKKTARRR